MADDCSLALSDPAHQLGQPIRSISIQVLIPGGGGGVVGCACLRSLRPTAMGASNLKRY